MIAAKEVADWELDLARLLDLSDFLFMDGIYKLKVCSFKDYSKWTYN